MTALQLTAEDYIAFRIDTVDLKHRLRDIKTDCRNRLHGLAPPNRGGLNSAHINGTVVPVEEPSTASEADVHPFRIDTYRLALSVRRARSRLFSRSVRSRWASRSCRTMAQEGRRAAGTRSSSCRAWSGPSSLPSPSAPSDRNRPCRSRQRWP